MGNRHQKLIQSFRSYASPDKNFELLSRNFAFERRDYLGTSLHNSGLGPGLFINPVIPLDYLELGEANAGQAAGAGSRSFRYQRLRPATHNPGRIVPMLLCSTP
jgi:hypothetical protein